MSDPTYGPKVYRKANGDELVVAAGGTLTVEEGATVAGIVAAEAATDSVAGKVELATSAEATTGTDTERAVTPKALADSVTTHVAAASATDAGKVELATDAETQTGTDAARAVTPASLAACTATEARKGIAELATAAEALAGTDTARTITPAGLQGSINNVELISFAGAAAAGPCTATGIKVGDVILSITGIAAGTVGDQIAKFEATVSVADQIQQSDAGNLSANIYLALVHRKS